ncbi:exosporium glycoprotein BclB-related protein [Paenibacillus eucommiae]|uniref:BclB C-terminal domain-containing protein n=1 Tax=Paenibacillus eucommiae TaxID=1355755 RepID=A0ABS4J8J6_9BACL|nr:exosporium glycoprotein BclB-related protein [Paenibacillus eucommiae]MBP1995590.1 BclB C-terminal domain-containing protein [Paenibacillus eucommiae]
MSCQKKHSKSGCDTPSSCNKKIIKVDCAPTNVKVKAPQGLRGLRGPQGPRGPRGRRGREGDAGPGAIIPYASGLPITMTTIGGGVVGTTGLIGFGSSATNIALAGGVIDLTGAGGTLLNMAFSVPRDGTITSISGFFSATVALAIATTTITITAQLFTETTTNIFRPIPEASVTLAPPIPGPIASGASSRGTNYGLDISVSEGDRLLMVFSATAAGTTLVNTVVGYASAGVTIN